MFLDEGVGTEASVSFWTFLLLFDEAAHLSMIVVPIPFPILDIMVVDAVFMVVGLGDVARGYLEGI